MTWLVRAEVRAMSVAASSPIGRHNDCAYLEVATFALSVRTGVSENPGAYVEVRGPLSLRGESGMLMGLALNLPDRPGASDAHVLKESLELLEYAQRHGFEAAFALEHHATGYLMSPSPFSLLSYIAGRFDSLHLATMVAVLPWYRIERLAEEICQLDNLNNGNCTFGLGRGRSISEHMRFGDGAKPSKEEFIRSVAELEDLIIEAASSSPHRLRPTPSYKPHERLALPARDIGAAVESAESGRFAIIEWEPRQIALCSGNQRSRAQVISKNVIVSMSIIIERTQELAADVAARASRNDLARRREHYGKHANTTPVLSGTPEMVGRELVALGMVLPNCRIAAEFSFGDLSPSEARRSLELYCREVMPGIARATLISEAI